MIGNTRESVIVVDYQNDFADKNGTLYVNGGELLVPYINSLMADIKNRSGIIITSQDWHPENHTSFAKTHGLDDYAQLNGDRKWPVHCVADTWGADFKDGFDKTMVDRKVFKGYEPNRDSYSSFGGIELLKDGEKRLNLDKILKIYGTRILNVVGLATDFCVKATVLDAINLGYEVKLHTRGISAVNVSPEDGEKAIQEMKEAGAIILP